MMANFEVIEIGNDTFSWGLDGTRRFYSGTATDHDNAYEDWLDGVLDYDDNRPMSRATTKPRVIVKNTDSGVSKSYPNPRTDT